MQNPIADTIAAIYIDRADGDQDWIRLAVLRPLVHKMIKARPDQVEAALLEMIKTGFVHLVPDSNRKALTKQDHAAAIRIGGEDKHLLCIEDEYFPTVERLIVDAYVQLREHPGDWIRLARIRPLVNAPRKEVDAALLKLIYTQLVHLAPESNTKMLQREDKKAAIRIGGEDLHIMCIEQEFFQPTKK